MAIDTRCLMQHFAGLSARPAVAFVCRRAAVRSLGLVTEASPAPSASCTQQVEGRMALAYKGSQKGWTELATEGGKKNLSEMFSFFLSGKQLFL